MNHIPDDVSRLENELKLVVSEILSQDPNGALRVEIAVQEALRMLPTMDRERSRHSLVERLKSSVR